MKKNKDINLSTGYKLGSDKRFDRMVEVKRDKSGNLIITHDPLSSHNDEIPIDEVKWLEYESKEGEEFVNSLPE